VRKKDEKLPRSADRIRKKGRKTAAFERERGVSSRKKKGRSEDRQRVKKGFKQGGGEKNLRKKKRKRHGVAPWIEKGTDGGERPSRTRKRKSAEITLRDGKEREIRRHIGKRIHTK